MVIVSVTAYAADITVTSEVSPTSTELNQPVTLSIVVSGKDAKKAGAPQLDEMEFFTTKYGGRAEQFSFVNGVTSRSITYTYYLVPRKFGTFKVGGVTISDGHNTYRAEPREVTVVGQVPQHKQPAPRIARDVQDDNIFIRTLVDNKEPYVGEQITLTFELYNRLTLWGETEYDPPATTGFWSIELPKIPQATKTVNNRMYQYQAIKTALFPTTSGDLTISPATLSYNTGGFFSAQRNRILKTDPITVKARPLPEKNKPSNFSGAVGEFNIQAKSDRNKVAVGDVITITVTVTGTGNLDLITSLVIPDLSGFRTYDPKVSDTIFNSGFTVGGVKSWEYVLMPQRQGTIDIAPFALNYFNPKTKKYETVKAESIHLTVTPGEVTNDAAQVVRGRNNALSNIAQDIVYIKPDKSVLASRNSRLYDQALFYMLYLLPLGGFIAAFVVKKRRDEIERNTGLKRKLNAWKNAETRLKKADSLTGTGNGEAFHGILHEAVTEYLGDIMNVDTGALTNADLEQTMKKHGLDSELAEKTRRTIELCDFVRFSSSNHGIEMQESLLRDCRTILSTIRETL